MLIAIERGEDFADLLLYFSGIDFDFRELIIYENFHIRTAKKRSKISGYQEDNGKLLLIRIGLVVSCDNFLHQLMPDNILD